MEKLLGIFDLPGQMAMIREDAWERGMGERDGFARG